MHFCCIVAFPLQRKNKKKWMRENYSLETIKCRVIHFSLLSSEETVLVTSTKYTENEGQSDDDKGQFQKALRENNSDYPILPSHSQ